jgi:hypothetical protein
MTTRAEGRIVERLPLRGGPTRRRPFGSRRCLLRSVDVTGACYLLPCRFSRRIEPWLTLIFPADSSSGFGYAASEIPGFFERLTPLQCSSSITRTA